MDRLNQLRGEAGGSEDSTLDTTSPPSEAFMSANENSSKYFSINDTTFDVSPIKDVSLASTSAEADRSIADNEELISNLSPIGKKELLDSYKIGKQIEAANILSGGVDIFEDNSFDGDELVIDDNAEAEDKVNIQPDVLPVENMPEPEPEPEPALLEPVMVEPVMAEPVLADPVLADPVLVNPVLVDPVVNEPVLVEPEANAANREMEVVLQIDGNNVNAIDIGNGLYLYRKDGLDELAAIQIIDDNPQHSFKFLKVRDNAEGNLEVYEEIEIEVPKEVPTKEGKSVDKNAPHVPTVDVKKQKDDSLTKNNLEGKTDSPQKEPVPSTSRSGKDTECAESSSEPKAELNLNGKMMKFNESRKSPVVGSFTPMTFHSTPNKEGKPLTKTMVDLQLDPNRHSDNVKKTIEVHTDNLKQKTELLIKEKDVTENVTPVDSAPKEKNQQENKKSSDKQDVKKNNSENDYKQNESVDAKSKENSKTNKPIINNDKEDTCIKKSETSDQNKDVTASNSSKESSNLEIKSLTTGSAGMGKALTPQSNLQGKTICYPDATENKTAEILTTSNNKTESSSKPAVDEPKCVDTVAKPAADINNTVQSLAENKNNLDEITMSTPADEKIIENSDSHDSNAKKDEHLNIKEDEIPVNVTSNSPNIKLTEKVSGGDQVSQDNIVKFPLESFADESSPCTNPENEESKEESITLYSVDTDESVSLLTPSNTTKTISDKVILNDNISEVLTTISNFSDIQTEIPSASVDKQNLLLPAKEPVTLSKSEIDSSNCSRLVQESSSKLENIAESPKFKANPTEISTVQILESKLPEKAASSIPLPKILAKDSNNSGLIKPLEAAEHSNLPDLKKQLSVVPEIKSVEIAIAETKPLAKISQAIPAPSVKPVDEPGKLYITTNVKTKAKQEQSVPKIESKILEKPAVPSVASDANVPEKKYSIPLVKQSGSTEISTSISTAVKQSEISSTTPNSRPSKLESHIPIVSIANKPSSKHIQVLKVEGVAKSISIVNQAEILKNKTEAKKLVVTKHETRDIKEPIRKPNLESKPVNNNHSAAVPFGKWTDAHRQEFLNKFKEVKAPVNSNSKQIKNSNDLNRRDVLQKIDSQRAQTICNASAKAQEKASMKTENVFSNKVSSVPETKTQPKNETADNKPKQVSNKAVIKQENLSKTGVTSNAPNSSETNVNVEKVCKTKPAARETTVGKNEVPQKEKNVGKVEPGQQQQSSVAKTETGPREQNTASCFMASLIDRTIEDMINRVVPGKHPDEVKQTATITGDTGPDAQKLILPQEIPKPTVNQSVSLDDIEMKMNELHGIPFVERPPHQLPKIPKSELKTYGKVQHVSSTPITTKPVKDANSDDEVIEHEPITGDIELNKRSVPVKLLSQDKNNLSVKSKDASVDNDLSKRDAEIITETDFDKFARRNSITYENCLTVTLDHKEQHNVVQTVKEKDPGAKLNVKQYSGRNEIKPKLPHKQFSRHDLHTDKNQGAKYSNVTGDSSNKKYPSKIHTAYQTALTAKHQVSRPISIIEDKPVKVVFLDSNAEFVPSQLNVQGQELSPAKKPAAEVNTMGINNDSLNPDILEDNEMLINKHTDVIDENKQQDKTKTKHQRKQVLTPVEAPDLELIQPGDIGIENSSKKKRKIEDSRAKNVVPKKSYLLDRNTAAEEKTTNVQSLAKDASKDIVKQDMMPEHKNAASAIDNLVKAAELLENQEESLNKCISPNLSTPNTPMKRGRGRPRKYPLLEGVADSKTPSPQKKPRLIDAKPAKQDSISDEPDDDSSGEEMIRENWTMGKINENIVCPICNKLFRSENVVFKHVKHCTGVSPNRSDSEKRSPRRSRLSQESDDADVDYEVSNSDTSTTQKDSPKKQKSKESAVTEVTPNELKLKVNKDDVIVIEDTPVKEGSENSIKGKEYECETVSNAKAPHRNKSLVCEFCGKTFRQQSYLSSHKLQHKKELAKKNERNIQDSNKPEVFSCEVCGKVFRKLHHLVQHRINHNPDSAPKRALRKSSSEQNDTRNVKEDAVAKQSDDASAGFRCEPCDKSFRKLHHLVEHRGTHDGINRQKPAAPAPAQSPVEKPAPPPTCEICNKTFRKLYHLIEHKEQHADTNSDKSDEKSIKSALSTKDIIHECSLCYMVFPNEHSLNKHSAMCSKKKRQSKTLKDRTANDPAKDEENLDEKIDEKEKDTPKIVAMEVIDDDENILKEQDNETNKKQSEEENKDEVEKPATAEITQKIDETIIEITPNQEKEKADESPPKEVKVESKDLQNTPVSKKLAESDLKKDIEKPVVPEKAKKIDLKEVKTQEISKKKIQQNDKTTPKRPKSIDALLPPAVTVKPSIESSDDDEVRYMFNPNFKVEESSEGKTFMKVRARKRNSLQIERPSSNDVAKRRTSLQHPPKIPRLKTKPVETKSKVIEAKPKAAEPRPKVPEPSVKSEIKAKSESKSSSAPLSKPKLMPKISKAETAMSTDSDDSDIKYSFPKASAVSKPERTPKVETKVPRKSLAEKRKSLSGIAKRKSMAKAVAAKHKDNPLPAKPIKKRWAVVEYRCDCGQLFSSAALLARHTSLAHTPPRIRRRRDPPPEPAPAPAHAPLTKPSAKPETKLSVKPETKPSVKPETKPSVKPDSAVTKLASTRKSSVKKPAASPGEPRDAEPRSARTTRRSAAHSGVPVPDKMRKLIAKGLRRRDASWDLD